MRAVAAARKAPVRVRSCGGRAMAAGARAHPVGAAARGIARQTRRRRAECSWRAPFAGGSGGGGGTSMGYARAPAAQSVDAGRRVEAAGMQHAGVPVAGRSDAGRAPRETDAAPDRHAALWAMSRVGAGALGGSLHGGLRVARTFVAAEEDGDTPRNTATCATMAAEALTVPEATTDALDDIENERDVIFKLANFNGMGCDPDSCSGDRGGGGMGLWAYIGLRG
uniref:Uncharacterized protein n=2 Tax=Viridiplantae TaxID=33090 RepID=A0A7R9TFJ2_9VIRI